MTEMLALKYRPQTFRDLVGQRPVQAVLARMVHETLPNGRLVLPAVARAVPEVPTGLLFTGTHGSGKTSTARILAAALNCASPGERPCTACPSCVAVRAGASTAVIEVDAASHGSVDEVRRLQEALSYDCGQPYRVVVLDEVHSMSRDAFNALLKLLEEPPPDTIFVLITTEPAKVLPTVASRCMPFRFHRIPPAVITERLAFISGAEGLAVEEELLGRLAEQAGGALRDAVMLLDQAVRAGTFDLARYQELSGETDFAPPLLGAMAKGDPRAMFAQLDQVLAGCDAAQVPARLVSALRDVLVLHAGGELAARGTPLVLREELARQLSAQQAYAVLRVLWDLKTKIRGSGREWLELAVVMGSAALKPVTPPVPLAPAPSVNGSARQEELTEEELAWELAR